MCASIIFTLQYGVPAVVKRAKGRRCSVCGRAGATLGCSSAKCGRSYHLPCAIEAGVQLAVGCLPAPADTECLVP